MAYYKHSLFVCHFNFSSYSQFHLSVCGLLYYSNKAHRELEWQPDLMQDYPSGIKSSSHCRCYLICRVLPTFSFWDSQQLSYILSWGQDIVFSPLQHSFIHPCLQFFWQSTMINNHSWPSLGWYHQYLHQLDNFTDICFVLSTIFPHLQLKPLAFSLFHF